MSSSPDTARRPAPSPPADAPTAETEASALAQQLDAAQRPGRAVPVDPPCANGDKTHGAGPAGGLVP